MSKARPWLIGTALVLGAGLLSGITPSPHSLFDPILVRGNSADTVTSRTLVAAVTGATFADQMTSSDGEWEADGNWLVIEIVVSAPQTEVDAEIALAALHVDDRVFHASERPRDSLMRTPLHVGTDTVGVIAFELPEGLRDGAAELRLSSRYTTPELDDVLTIDLPLGAVKAIPRVELEEPRLGAP